MADMSDILKNLSSIMDGKEIPDNIQELLQSIKITNNSDKTNFSSNENDSNNSNNSKNVPNIDMESILKIQKIMNSINKSSNSSGANLLRSLKPYLNPNRQEKIDEYIQLFNIEQMFELLKQSGGDKKR